MTLPKMSLILGSAVVAVGAGAYVMWGNNPEQGGGGEILLGNYQDLLEDLKDSKTKDKLSVSCEKPEKFDSQIKDLEDRLKELQDKKNELLDSIPKLPDIKDEDIVIIDSESQALELSDGDYSDRVPVLPEISDDSIEIVPEVGSQLPELSDGDYSDQVPVLPEISDDSIEIVPKPGSQPPELSDGDYSDPRPGSQVPELSDGNYFNEIPELPEISEHDGGSIFDQIDETEQQIIAEINNLKSLCDKEEIVSTSCPEACKKYSDCAEYTEGVTKEDIKDAYDSCMEECVKWSDKTKICINKKKIREPLDCRDLSFCVLPEYGGPGVEVLK